MSTKKNCTHIFFETLATKLKIDILITLKENELNVTKLATALNQERSKVSHALISLSDCNFVTAKKKGNQRIYSVNEETIIPLLDIIEKHIKYYCKVCKKVKK